ncbi:MAG: hypothetical protein AAF921_12745 [Cyanobacteria bacterium P01_D01_bin.44]
MADELIREMQAQVKAERQRAERMAEYLRTDKSALALSLGIDPDNLPNRSLLTFAEG